ncbi:MAG: hypothetical protein KC553_00075 [Nitrospina sp.]|nr:hypothetical protein [Nitrospina sp.]
MDFNPIIHPDPAPGRLLWITGLLMSLVFMAGGCNVGARTMALFGGELNVQVQINPNANHNQPLMVDLVLVNDSELLKTLMGIPASEWFAKRDQFKRDYPKRTGFESWEWEWTPGQQVPDLILPIRVRAEAGIIFVRYYSEGDHRARFDPLKNILIEFKEDDFQVTVTQGT